MILQNILKYRNGSNFAHTLLSTIKSSGGNPPEKNFFDHVNKCFTNPKCGFYKSKKYSFYKIPIIGITKSFKKNEKDWNNFFNINGFNCKN